MTKSGKNMMFLGENIFSKSIKIFMYYFYNVMYILSLYQIGKTDVEDIVIDKEEVNLLVGETQKINATILPENATNKLIKFSSSNENVASVRQDGLIVAKSTGKGYVWQSKKWFSNNKKIYYCHDCGNNFRA